MPTTVTCPPRRVARQAARMVAARPTHSKAWSAPRPSVRARISLDSRVVGDAGSRWRRRRAPGRALASATSTAMTGSAPARAGGGDHREADPAETDHRHRLAGRDPGGVAHRADAGQHRAAQQGGLLKGSPAGTGITAFSRHHHLPRRARPGRGSTCSGVAVDGARRRQRRAPVAAAQSHGSPCRQYQHSRQAGAQLSTTWCRRGPGRRPRRSRPPRRPPRARAPAGTAGERAVDHGQVGVADAGRPDRHPHLAGAELGQATCSTQLGAGLARPRGRDRRARRSPPPTRPRTLGAHRWIAFICRNSASPYAPSSRPRPDCL